MPMHFTTLQSHSVIDGHGPKTNRNATASLSFGQTNYVEGTWTISENKEVPFVQTVSEQRRMERSLDDYQMISKGKPGECGTTILA